MLDNIINLSKYVIDNENKKDVKINFDKIDILINEISDFRYQHYLTTNPFGIMELSTEDLINFLLIYDSIDFSFWGNPKWSIDINGELIDGGAALLYAMLRMFKSVKGNQFFQYLSELTKENFSLFLKGNVEIPLFDERYNTVTSIARIVNDKMNGNFYDYIKNIKSDKELFNLIISIFPSFKDVRTYNNKEIPFYKLAQLLTSDILHMLEFKENIQVDYSNLVGCADYKIPQVLRAYGILEYSSNLSEIIDSKTEITENDSYEVEIRSATLVVIDYIYEQLNKTISRIDINDYIWGKGRNKNLILNPYHLTRTTSY